MTIWFISDLHFDHRRIIEHCKRPHETVQEMNDNMIHSWNHVVKPADVVYVLGDFSFSKTPDLHFSKLKGIKHLIKGNHDHKDVCNLNWMSVQTYGEIRIDDDLVCMSHFPMLSWHQMHRGSYMLHGHCHGSLEYPNSLITQRIFDVGVDNLINVIGAYGPISWLQLKLHLRKREFTKVDHHG